MNGRDDERGRRRRRVISEEEAELWSFATRATMPARTKPRVAGVDPAEAKPKPRVAPLKPPDGDTVGKGDRPSPALPKAPAVEPAPKPLPAFERREVRRLVSGRLSIDARLDLHGMRQVDAHSRLRGFVTACARGGMSHVLVITGKGGERPDHAGDEVIRSDRRGVLKRLVPIWLGEPDLRPYVLSFSEAHVRHGGAGALYVRLRKVGR